MPYCANCGNELDDTDQFCGACGSSVEGGDMASREKDSHDRKATLIFFVFMVVLFLVWLAMGMPTDRFYWR